MLGSLPETLTVNGIDYPIRTDYRNVLQIFEAFNDPELEAGEKGMVAIYILFSDFNCADDVEEAAKNGFDVNEAAEQIIWFIHCGTDNKNGTEKPTYDWEKDEQMIFSAVNKVANKEVRELEYMHWWTFLGYFNEIGEGIFSYIVHIRDKRNKHKKLDKSEWDFYKKNKDMINLTPRKTKEQLEEDALWDEIL